MVPSPWMANAGTAMAATRAPEATTAPTDFRLTFFRLDFAIMGFLSLMRTLCFMASGIVPQKPKM